MRLKEIEVPKPVSRLMERLEERGFSAWAVGGCVRDSLIGKKPGDWDITTNALPAQVIECFRDCRVIETGLKHGTVTVMMDRMPLEVTTFRVDGTYEDHRHPSEVKFVTSLEEDLARRDFTVNAMAWHPDRGLADPFAGQKDLEQGLIRCVGTAQNRFEEDALRIMRALRFASVYGFELERETSDAIHQRKRLLKQVAVERIRVELERMLCGDGAEKILSDYPDVLEEVIPELGPMVGFDQHNRHHCFDVWRHTARSVYLIPAEPILRMTMLLHDVGKPACFSQDERGVGHFYGHPKAGAHIASDLLTRLKLDNESKRQIRELVLFHDVRLGAGLRGVRRLLSKVGEERYRQLLLVKRADILAQSAYRREEKLSMIERMAEGLETVLEQKQCFQMCDLAVDGRELMAEGIPQGRELGLILKQLLEEVIEGSLENDREVLLGRARVVSPVIGVLDRDSRKTVL